jgi:AraC-like DNA-binding protein
VRSPRRTPPPIFWRDRALPFLEGRAAFDSVACYRPHTHPALSIGIVDAGASSFYLGHAGDQQLSAGDVVVVPAFAVHACNPLAGRWSYRMFHVDPVWLAGALGPGTQLSTGAARVIRGEAARDAVARLQRVLLATGRASARSRELLDAVSQLGLVAPSAPVAPRVAPPQPPALAEVRTTLARRCDEPLDVRQLARQSGLGYFELIRRFKAHFGLTPHAFQLDAKVTRARALLAGGARLAEVTYQLGFADQSHFHRVFTQRVAATPLEFQRSADLAELRSTAGAVAGSRARRLIRPADRSAP